MDESQQGQGHGAVITVEAKVLGQRKPAISGWQVALPALPAAERADAGGYLRLRDLLAGIVRQEALAFRQRQEERRLVRVLSPTGIQRAAATGKIDMFGPRELQVQSGGSSSPQANLPAEDDARANLPLVEVWRRWEGSRAAADG